MYSFIYFAKEDKRLDGPVREFRWSLMKLDVFEKLIKESGNMKVKKLLYFFSFTKRTAVNVKS